jgi:DNA-binding GntR family transcriptional regulator
VLASATVEHGQLSGQVSLKTVEEQVVDALRDLIVRGSLQPGESLRLADLSNALGVSTLPVRQALRRLEVERLVIQIPRRGAVVAPLELDDLEEIQAVREGIEGLAARVGVVQLDAKATKEMRGLLTSLERLAEQRERDRFLLAQWGLHDICYRASDRPQLLSLIDAYRQRAERYVRLAIDSTHEFSESLSSQSQFVEACEDHDPQAAEEVVRLAMRWTVRTVAGRLQSAQA